MTIFAPRLVSSVHERKDGRRTPIEIGWTVVGIVVPLLVGIAVSVVGLNPPESKAARTSLYSAALLLGGMEIVWYMQTGYSFFWRVAIACALCLSIGIGLPEGLRWVKRRELLIVVPPPAPEKPLTIVAPPTPAPPAALLDPIVHIEPENKIVFSTRSDLGQTKGIYNITLNNTGLEDVDVTELLQRFFLAEKGQTIILKRVHDVVSNRQTILKSKGKLPVRLDFNPYLETFKEVAANFAGGPSRAGVYIIAKCRRLADGKDYTFTRSYGLFNFDAVAIFTEGTSMDEVLAPPQFKSQFLTLSEIVPYLDSADHWTSVITEVSTDANGKIHKRMH